MAFLSIESKISKGLNMDKILRDFADDHKK